MYLIILISWYTPCRQTSTFYIFMIQNIRTIKDWQHIQNANYSTCQCYTIRCSTLWIILDLSKQQTYNKQKICKVFHDFIFKLFCRYLWTHLYWILNFLKHINKGSRTCWFCWFVLGSTNCLSLFDFFGGWSSIDIPW